MVCSTRGHPPGGPRRRSPRTEATMSRSVTDTESPEEVRRRLVLPLDVDDLVTANRLVRSVGGHFGVVKVGLELYSAAGPDAISTFVEQGFHVFADLKLCDIPTTVEHAAR